MYALPSSDPSTTQFSHVLQGSDSQILYVPPALTTAGYAGTTDTYIWNISSTVFPSNASEVITTIWPSTALGTGSYAKKLTISQTSCQ
jgi:hypothetical protein